MADANGDITYGTETLTSKPCGYHDICLAAERTYDLLHDTDDIPVGSQVWLKAVIVGGKDKESRDHYIYSPDSGKTAAYQVSGTTLINSLKRVSYE